MAKCKFCGAKITWRKSKAGNWYPLDVETAEWLPHHLFCDPNNFLRLAWEAAHRKQESLPLE